MLHRSMVLSTRNASPNRKAKSDLPLSTIAALERGAGTLDMAIASVLEHVLGVKLRGIG